MWIFMFLSLLTMCMLLIRRNKFIRTYLHPWLYRFGLQLGSHIYTPVCDIYSNFRYFDIVLLMKYKGSLYMYRLFHHEQIQIPLKYIPVGHHLKYKINDEEHEHLYLEGTPFQLHKGELILYQRKARRLGFISIEVGRSDKWPFE